jgi:Dolichyl-phosphate-mannose-protein mannosyltransferase
MLREATEILPARTGLALRSHAFAAGYWLVAIVAASAAVRILFALRTPAPWILPDELVYTHLARSLGETGHFAVREQPFSAWSFGPLYPLLIAPLYRIASPGDAYVAVKVLNCVLFSFAAVPAYFLARRALTERSALILAALAVFVPSAIYTSKVMTESLAYPLFLVAALMIVRVIETPSRAGELAALAAIAAATLARGQLVVLFPAFVITLLIVSRRRLAAYQVTWLATLVGLAGLAVFRGEFAGRHSEALGAVSVPAVAASFFNHLVEFNLYLGAIPVAALAFILGCAGDRRLRIIGVFAATVTILLAASSARYLVAVEGGDPALTFDRYLFYAAPLILIAFLAWLERDTPRPRLLLTATVAVAVCALPLALPYDELLTGRQWGTNSSTVGLVPWGILSVATGSLASVYISLLLGGAVLAYVVCRTTNRSLLLGMVVATLASISLVAQVGNATVSKRALRAGIGTERAWIDGAVGPNAQVSALWASDSVALTKRWYRIWENEIFNESVRRVYVLGSQMRYALPQVPLHRSGRELYSAEGKPFVAEYVLTDARTPVDGTRIAADSRTGMVLLRVRGAVSLR